MRACSSAFSTAVIVWPPAKIAGVEPDAYEIDEESASGETFDTLAYVLSTNLNRRHLTESQRAMVSVESEKFYAVIAKERQKRKPAGSVPAPAPEQKGDAREMAAKTLNISPRLVTAAKRVVEGGAVKVGAAVRSGKLSVTVAEKLVRSVPDKKRQAAIVDRAVSDGDIRKINGRIKFAIETCEHQKSAAIEQIDESQLRRYWESLSRQLRLAKHDVVSLQSRGVFNPEQLRVANENSTKSILRDATEALPALRSLIALLEEVGDEP